jgi:hypothetical protein
MPGPVGRDPLVAGDVLENTCYQCHPGKRTECLRGAMAAGGVVCQDCHGNMQQVGNDFSMRVSTGNAGDFILDGSLRVPWASEPGCQSCHTGDAVNTNHPPGAIVSDDGIRLLQAYQSETLSVPGVTQPVQVATMLKSRDSRFAENTAFNADGAEVDLLYRLSKGHGGVMCEGCHNSTHAIWPVQNPSANDNIASQQLQGHHGTLVECSTCHASFDIDDFKGNLDGKGQMKGPHGMHPVNSPMWNEKHKEVFKDERSPATVCSSCHGADGRGTVLSRVADRRELECKSKEGTLCADSDATAVFNKGDQVGCLECHSNQIADNND